MFLVLIFTRGWVDPRAMVRSEENVSLKNPVTPPGIDPRTVRPVAQCLNHYSTPSPRNGDVDPQILHHDTKLRSMVSDKPRQIYSREWASDTNCIRRRMAPRNGLPDLLKYLKIEQEPSDIQPLSFPLYWLNHPPSPLLTDCTASHIRRQYYP
jgi:hypothetical protein